MTYTSTPASTRQVVAIGGPRIGQHGTAPAAQMRRSALLTILAADRPWALPAGCQVTWDDSITTSYAVGWLRPL
jgi:hypothetical protein